LPRFVLTDTSREFVLDPTGGDEVAEFTRAAS
jgi:hypothetical protein